MIFLQEKNTFTWRNFLYSQKFSLQEEIYFPGENNHLPEEIVRPKPPFLIENQGNLFIQWEKLFEQRKEREI